ncbi:MAG: Gfo/Idh/MocA family oxidoreductase [Bacteroidota bacterium]
MTTRRSFLKKSTVAGLSALAMPAASYARILGANDRINVAFMGLGRRVPAYFDSLRKKHNSHLLYLCDVKKSQVAKTQNRLKAIIDYQPKVEEDIRIILENKDLDAVFVATPDHWHAHATSMALDAGKHVYVEKPCAHNPKEGEIMVARQAATGKMVQMGNQQRSAPHSIEIIKAIHEGAIGKPYKAIAFYSNGRGEVPHQIKQAPPADLNWDLFQGPAPRQDYFHDIWNYNWHWYGWKWGTAESGNNAIHELDIARWALQVDFPDHVSVNASKKHYQDDGWEMYDSMYATYTYGENKEIHWDGNSRNGYNTYGAGRGTLIYGTEGSVFVNRAQYKLFDRGGKLIKESTKTNETGVALGGAGNMSTQHIANFYESIRGKATLNAPIKDGAKSNHLALLANISYRIGAGFDVDNQTGNAFNREAMQLWSRTYETGWELE